jgi:hypothetical protein
MTTHILNLGYTTGQTLTAKRFAIGSDTVIESDVVGTEATNRKGRYNFPFVNVAAGDYLIVYFIGAVGAGSEYVTFAGTDGEVATPWSERKAAVLDSSTSAQITTIAEVLGATMRGDRSHSEALDLILAATIGKSSQPSGTTERFKFLDDADAFTTTFDTNGNRTAVSLS